MTITISAEDTRSIKALEIAAGASRWAKIRSKDGQHKAYGIPSSCEPGRFYLVTCSSCDCQDFKRHNSPCKHVLAVRLHCEMVKASQPKSKAKKPAAAPAPATGGVVLTMVRHGDRDATWEDHNYPRPVADASTYDRIFGREPAF